MTLYAYTVKGIRNEYDSDNLARTFDDYVKRAMLNPDCIRGGLDWYDHARIELVAIANEYGHTLNAVAACAAVLSSCMPWERNLPALITILDAWRDGKRGTKLPAVSRNYECVRKCERILNGAIPSQTIVKRSRNVNGQSFKTLNFYYNLIGASNFVTVDVWMWRALSGDHKTTYRPDGRLYVECANIIRNAAYALNVQPMQLQAIVWMLLVDKGALMHKG